MDQIDALDMTVSIVIKKVFLRDYYILGLSFYLCRRVSTLVTITDQKNISCIIYIYIINIHIIIYIYINNVPTYNIQYIYI